jgi:hypothetical protein
MGDLKGDRATQTANHFTLQRRRSNDGTPRLENWGGVRQRKPIDRWMCCWIARLFAPPRDELSVGVHLREAPCNIQRAQAQYKELISAYEISEFGFIGLNQARNWRCRSIRAIQA